MPTADLNDELARRMRRLGVQEEDLDERFIRGAGAGGQKINKTSSTVQLKHLPSGIEIRCQRERKQSTNRYWARMELCDRIEAKRREIRMEAQQEREKERRQNRPRPRGVKEDILRQKKVRSQVKKQRGTPRRGSEE
jgi:peptide chain release factor